MNVRRYCLLFFAAAVSLGGCVVYEPVAVVAPQQTTAQRFDRSWSAVLGAMSDQGLTIMSQDYAAGVVTGRQGRVGPVISATLQTLPDGSVQVRFASRGGASDDPGLIDRVSSSFDRRIGR